MFIREYNDNVKQIQELKNPLTGLMKKKSDVEKQPMTGKNFEGQNIDVTAGI